MSGRQGAYHPCKEGNSRRNSPLKGFHYQISQDTFSLHFASQAVEFSLAQIFLKLMGESRGNSKDLKLTSPRGLEYPSWPFISIWFCFQEGFRQKTSSFVRKDWYICTVTCAFFWWPTVRTCSLFPKYREIVAFSMLHCQPDTSNKGFALSIHALKI